MKNKWWWLALSFAVFDMADCFSTLYALQFNGVFEANPVMSLVLKLGPIPFVIVKILAAAIGFVIYKSTNVSKWAKVALVGLNIVYLFVVLNNVSNLIHINFKH